MKNKTKFQARQGDVLIESADSVPSKAGQKKGKVILAYGEVTGHAHEVDEAEAWKSGADVVAIRVLGPTRIKHQEHGPIPLAPGDYQIVRQREYSPEAIRRVAD